MTVSVIVPVYNAEDYLDECVQSVIDQTFTDWELILVDDGSADGSGAICDGYANSNAKIHVIHQENAGVSRARNAGLDAARGEYIAFLDSDDCYTPDFLEAMVATIQGADLCVCGYWVERENASDAVIYSQLPEGEISRNDLSRLLLAAGTCSAVWNKLFRRGILEAHGLRMQPGLAIGEDRDFLLRALAHAEAIRHLPRPLYHYRIVAGSATNALHSDGAERIPAAVERDRARFLALGLPPEEVERGCEDLLVKALHSEMWALAENPDPRALGPLQAFLRSQAMRSYRRRPLRELRRRFPGKLPLLVHLCAKAGWARAMRAVIKALRR